jgi:hypothetical protein
VVGIMLKDLLDRLRELQPSNDTDPFIPRYVSPMSSIARRGNRASNQHSSTRLGPARLLQANKNDVEDTTKYLHLALE